MRTFYNLLASLAKPEMDLEEPLAESSTPLQKANSNLLLNVEKELNEKKSAPVIRALHKAEALLRKSDDQLQINTLIMKLMDMFDERGLEIKFAIYLIIKHCAHLFQKVINKEEISQILIKSLYSDDLYCRIITQKIIVEVYEHLP